MMLLRALGGLLILPLAPLLALDWLWRNHGPSTKRIRRAAKENRRRLRAWRASRGS